MTSSIILDLRTKNEKRFFQILNENQETPLPFLYSKIPISSVYRIKERIKLFEEACNIKFFDEKEINSNNNQISKILIKKYSIEKFIEITENKSIIFLNIS